MDVIQNTLGMGVGVGYYGKFDFMDYIRIYYWHFEISIKTNCDTFFENA